MTERWARSNCITIYSELASKHHAFKLTGAQHGEVKSSVAGSQNVTMRGVSGAVVDVENAAYKRNFDKVYKIDNVRLIFLCKSG